MNKKVQKGGENSTNIQVENINISQGITYSDSEAHKIACDVYRSNFLKLSKEAAEVAQARAEKITKKFLMPLHKEYAKGLENAKNPDFQRALFTVQKEYALTGDDELGDLLVDLLIDRTKQDNRSLLQIVLNESLSVVPKLTNDQLAALSVFFLIFSTIERDINSYDSPRQYLDLYIKPFSGFLTKNASCYQHLEYTGCCAIGTGRKILVRLFKDRYSIVFRRALQKNFCKIKVF